jgi:hypothetical protein
MPELTEAEKRQLAAAVATTRGGPVTRDAAAAWGSKPVSLPSKPAGRRRKTRKARKTRRRATRNRRR